MIKKISLTLFLYSLILKAEISGSVLLIEKILEINEHKFSEKNKSKKTNTIPTIVNIYTGFSANIPTIDLALWFLAETYVVPNKAFVLGAKIIKKNKNKRLNFRTFLGFNFEFTEQTKVQILIEPKPFVISFGLTQAVLQTTELGLLINLETTTKTNSEKVKNDTANTQINRAINHQTDSPKNQKKEREAEAEIKDEKEFLQNEVIPFKPEHLNQNKQKQFKSAEPTQTRPFSARIEQPTIASATKIQSASIINLSITSPHLIKQHTIASTTTNFLPSNSIISNAKPQCTSIHIISKSNQPNQNLAKSLTSVTPITNQNYPSILPSSEEPSLKSLQQNMSLHHQNFKEIIKNNSNETLKTIFNSANIKTNNITQDELTTIVKSLQLSENFFKHRLNEIADIKNILMNPKISNQNLSPHCKKLLNKNKAQGMHTILIILQAQKKSSSEPNKIKLFNYINEKIKQETNQIIYKQKKEEQNQQIKNCLLLLENIQLFYQTLQKFANEKKLIKTSLTTSIKKTFKKNNKKIQ